MTKKLTRSKRKDLRAKGQLKPVPRVDPAQKAAERQAEEEAVSARVHDAREAIAHRDEVEPAPASQKKPKAGRRDLTLLLLAGLTGVAGLIYWLSQRPPTPAAEPAPQATATAAARTPVFLPPHPVSPAPSATPEPAITATAAAPPPPPPPPPPPAAPAATARPAAPKAAPAEPAKPPPAPAPAKPPAKKSESADPYG